MQALQPGDHLVTNIDVLGLTEHHGLYVGNGNVIHLSKQGMIEEIDLQRFAGGHKIRVKKSSLFPHQAIELARSQLGYTSYGVATNNCEQFVNECLERTSTSNQVSNLTHVALQGSARAGLLGSTASKLATGTVANVVLASTAVKMTGEYLGLPDNLNTLLGTPGDLVAKPAECLLKGTTQTLGESYDCLSQGEIADAGIKLVTGSLETGLNTMLMTAEVGINGVKAGAELIADAWHWLRS
ncbi:acyltransferase [Shewanella xiamenensis]|uniref:lecithin retinol acyltransferase family protein n=1 Tax=Shewanella xiamenensis TaxID=332186 RepID=UPI001C4DFC00|nr:lecithin retinol acyltransferase family protein [Shewanella xiamenensis]MBW0279909.1 acyltransferase [Shewanella xiamenensis]MBW0296570.1 acyltransferase [Shewanella xiamenensis]MCT8873372.1 lecithin retinol acyltransferase family protein [Shewanella xiamenensis]UWH42526.1 lecithin retinol acyltransferase family protein [Shewanella xiamenensis]